MPKAVWNGATLAESAETIMVEGNHYFPPESVDSSLFEDSRNQTQCHWKGLASYYDVVVNGETYRDGAWYYAEPSQAASEIKDYVAFYGGVTIES